MIETQATDDVWLPIEPFRDFMKHVVRAESIRLGLEGDAQRSDGYCSVTANSVAASRLGIERKTFIGYLRGSVDKISFRAVDRMLAKHGDYSVWDVYPPEVLENIRLTIAKDARRCVQCGIEMPATPSKVKRCGFCREERRNGTQR